LKPIIIFTFVWYFVKESVMKKIIVLLSICFGGVAFAQEGVVSQNVQVGAIVPDFALNVLTKEGVTKVNIRDYRGKVVILEFWATYCGPCLPAMDHLSEIKNKIPNEFEAFAITDEERPKVVSFLNQRPTSLQVALDENHELNKLFYHQFMPHTVIIGTDGIVKAITSPDQITEEVIYMVKSGAEIVVKTKAEFVSKDENATALVPVSLEDNSLYKVIISPAVEGIQAQVNKKASNEYEFVNCSVPMMYQALYQTTLPNPEERPCLEVTQQTKYLLQENHQYCLKLKVPEKMQDRIGTIGMQHLEELFAIKPQNEMRTRNVYALVLNATEADSTDTTETGKITIKEFIKLLWETRLVDKPVVNESGLPDDAVLDIDLPTQVHEVSDRLAHLGLKLEPKSKEMSCLILHDGR
jgi:thiol-disulfide isomerase/thioredoxin